MKVKYRNEEDYHIKGTNCAGRWSWAHYGGDGDIIAYRLHQPQEVAQDKAGDEAELNECVGQMSEPVWSGEELTPPVGCICERSLAGDKWQPCKILFTSNQFVVVNLKESGIEEAYVISDVTFRSLRTKADKKRDSAIGAIDLELLLVRNSSNTAEAIYDAIAAGKIPGVKLEGL